MSRASNGVMDTKTADKLIVQEVAPRDGLQIEPTWVDTADKIGLINALSTAGFTRIEAGSFVSPKAIPALRDGEAVFQQIERHAGVIYVALVPNLKGAERALAAKADELNLVMSASQTHNRANMRMSCELSLTAFGDIVRHVKDSGVLLNASVATAFGCPFEGTIDEDRVVGIVDTYREMGIQGITLADTTGMANPRQVTRLVTRVLERVTPSALTLHFHNTRGLGLANVLAAYEAGARRFDAALGGLGGCPFAPGASGNICTEDLVNLCDEMGIPTGIDLEKLLALSRALPDLLGHDVPGQVAKAGRNSDLHPVPDYVLQI
ncbi:hydroxymethylglutaryl-CoA lyase [Paraburkholderia strydomiana]